MTDNIQVHFTYKMHSGILNSCGKLSLKLNFDDFDENELLEYIINSIESEKNIIQKKINRQVLYETTPDFKILKKYIRKVYKKNNNNEEQNNDDDDEQLLIRDWEWSEDSNEDDFPRGWKNRKTFVSKDGKFYEKGKVIPEKYRTKRPSKY